MKSKSSATDETLLRADAVRNRERILEAAEKMFIERGADVSLDDIARRAGVGIGTLYRRFPTRDALLAATSDERLLALAQASRARDDRLEPIASIRVFVKELVTHANHYRGLAALLGTVLQSNTPGCHAGREEGRRLLQRAQKAGAVRKDVSLDDLLCIITAISLAVEQGSTAKSRVGHMVDLFLDGIGNTGAT
ncbi:TetR/AcrR family transcriptional regulator [Paraburkholderia sp. MMS20-SJTR3]|uniref:TetR/AcrR family transcriptional regulator n=1 Tax=Paraburkholderia sejongensis TaxID=2886946 RepID=A0ABS8JQH9_9BURK|nr:TetR/AcrR family transcriptional regulator [Paraburkholderia sp. MMS20-SJTR3]MCC8392171.1 TetR/AcrR family transcriptional regulator [Paraburkholderia sp. MMS20-SJTR3]